MIGERNFVLPLTALLDGRQDPRILVLVVEIIGTHARTHARTPVQSLTKCLRSSSPPQQTLCSTLMNGTARSW